MKASRLRLLLLCALLASTARLPAASTIDPAHRFAYGANIGWVDCRADGANGAVVGEYVCSGWIYSANCGWIGLGSGAPTNGVRYCNASASDYGVNHEPGGRLRGFAYGANIGWVAFESNGAPRVNLATGALDGCAYGANVGWISLSNAFACVRTASVRAGADADADAIPDAWEILRAGRTGWLGRSGDADGDGASDFEEYVADTDPLDSGDVLRVTDFTVGDSMRVSWRPSPSRLYRLSGRAPGPAGEAEWSTDWATGGATEVPLPGPEAGVMRLRVTAPALRQ